MTTTAASLQSASRARSVRQRRKQARNLGIQVTGFLALMVIWWAATKAGLVSATFLPSPGAVWNAFVEANGCRPLGGGRTECGVYNYYMWEHLLMSLQRIAIGLGIAIVAGIALGLMMGSIPVLNVLFAPYLNFIRTLPPLGYLGLIIVWVGIGEEAKLWLLFLAAFPPIVIATVGGVRSVRREQVQAAQSLGASRLQVVKYVVLPSSLGSIIQGIRLAAGFTWTTVVAAELNNGIPGIGGLAYLAGTRLQTALTIASVIVIGVVAVVIDYGIRKLGEVLVPWQGKA